MTESTRDALLDAAEAVFASDGIEQASLRGIMRTAGADPGAIHYHFGSRATLARAVLDRVLAPLQERRLELLDELTAGEAPAALEDLVAALVRPDLEQAAKLGSRSAHGHRLLGAIYLHPALFVTKQVEESFAPVAARFLPQLTRAAPHVGPTQLAWRVRWAVFGVLGARLADPDLDVTLDADVELARLVRVMAAALAAPTEETVP